VDKPPVLISEAAIRKRVAELAEQVSSDYANKGDIVLIGVLKGSFIFLAELTIPRTIEFIAVSSYGSSSTSTGAVRLVMDVRGNIENRHVLIVEDIVDTGHTLNYLIGILESHRPASIRTCTLLHKAEAAEVDIDIDYVGFGIGDEWVVGYGLDFAERDRTLPYIGTRCPTSARLRLTSNIRAIVDFEFNRAMADAVIAAQQFLGPANHVSRVRRLRFQAHMHCQH